MDGQEEARRTAGRNVERAMDEHTPPMNLSELSRAAEVDPQTLRDLISGKRRPHAKTLAKIDVALAQRPGTIRAWYDNDTEFFEQEPSLQEQREARGLSRAELAEMIGAGKGTLAEWERGEPIPAVIAERLRDALADVPTDELVAELGRRAKRGLG